MPVVLSVREKGSQILEAEVFLNNNNLKRRRHLKCRGSLAKRVHNIITSCLGSQWV